MWTEGKGLKNNALDLCKDFLGGAWKNVTSDEIIVDKLSGGMTNLLYLCRLPEHVHPIDQEPRNAVLRIYAKQDNDANSIVIETTVFMLLSERKLGPKLYGIFPYGRLEEYIPSCCTSWDDMRLPHISAALAEELARVHCLEVPIKKKPILLINQMKSWLKCFRNNVALGGLSPEDTKIAEYVANFDLEYEIRWLDSEMKKTGSTVVFSHNDLQGGNILLPRSVEGQMGKKPIVFIDFEYSSYNYRGFDIGNHFCEWCFSYTGNEYPCFETDLTRFPGKDEQMHFVKAYVKQMEDAHPGLNSHVSVSDIMEEINIFALAAHMFWSLWSYFMAYTSPVSFAYWEYGKTRLEAYRQQKATFFSTLEDIPTLQNGDLSS